MSKEAELLEIRKLVCIENLDLSVKFSDLEDKDSMPRSLTCFDDDNNLSCVEDTCDEATSLNLSRFALF